MKKLISILLSLCVLFIMTPCETHAEENPNLHLVATSVSLVDAVNLVYYYHSDSSASVRMLVWTEPQAEYTYSTAETILDATTKADALGETGCDKFYYKKLAAKQMTDVVYTCAYTQINGQDYYSGITKYSIMDYIYNKLGYKDPSKVTTNDTFKPLLESMLVYGGNAQMYFTYNTDDLASERHYWVRTVNGTLPDGFASGLYLPGTEVVLEAPAANGDAVPFSHWEDSAGNNVGATAQAIVTVGNENEVYTAVYSSDTDTNTKPAASEGLEIESDDDGAYVIGIGECTDSYIVLPDTYDGKSVISIDGGAFENESITAIYIPKTVTDIGAKAFNGCAKLTDVYYEGSEDDWDDVSVGRSNDPLKNAEFHYNAYSNIKKYTVTFEDWDGTVLAKETVEAGNDATPPADPARSGYTFIRWDGDYSNVQENTTIKAQYENTTEPLIVADSTVAGAGKQIKVNISLKNNPGIAVSALDVDFDSDILTLDAVTYGELFQEGGEMPPLVNPVRLTWSSVSNVSGDAVYATLTFTVKDTAQTGASASINVSYQDGNISDFDENMIVFQTRSGSVTVR